MAIVVPRMNLPFALAAGLLIAFAAGCGDGGSGGGAAPEPEACDDLQLAVSEAVPLEQIAITGIPAHFGVFLSAKVRVPGGEESTTLVARQDDSEEIILHAPIHPEGLADGGEVELQIIDEDGRSCESIAFRILPLPAATGTTQTLYDTIASLLELQARYFETSVAELRETEPEDLPEYLLPLYLAQHSLDDPENPNSLEAFLAGTAPNLEGAALDIDFLDRLLAQIGVAAALDESLAQLGELMEDEETLDTESETASLQQGLGSMSDPRNAFQLHTEMELAQWARAFQGEGGLAQATRGLSTATGLAGFVPYPPVKAGAMVAGTALFTFMKMTEAAANLLPSRFVSLDFELSPSFFAEDDPSTGRWHDVMVVAASEGWKLDKAILETLLQITKVKGGYDGWMNRFAPKGMMASLGNNLRTRAVGKVIDLSADGSGILHIPPKQTRPIDITEEPWSFAEISFVLVEDGRQGYRLDSSWAGSDEGEIQIGTALGMFGGNHLYTRKKVRVDPLDIRFEPSSASVDPGETVDFRVTVPNAHDKTLSIEAERGTIRANRQGDGSYSVRYTAPASEDDLPDTITATSESASGLLSNPARRKPWGIAAIRSKNAYIEITPDFACVKSGQTQAFTAEVFNLDSQAVRWETSIGKISGAGVFTAPSESGVATITATSVQREEVTGTITVSYGSCTCTWSVSVSGGSLGRFGGTQFSVMTDEGLLASLLFSAPAEASFFPAGVVGEMEHGPMLGFPGSGDFHLQGSYFGSGEDADLFNTDSPVLLSLERFEMQGERLHIKGTVNGTVYWEIIGDRTPEDGEVWPGNLSLSFDGLLVPAQFAPGIFSCDPFG